MKRSSAHKPEHFSPRAGSAMLAHEIYRSTRVRAAGARGSRPLRCGWPTLESRARAREHPPPRRGDERDPAAPRTAKRAGRRETRAPARRGRPGRAARCGAAGAHGKPAASRVRDGERRARSRAMRDADLSTRRLATGAVALSAPRPRVKLQLEGTLPHDLTEAVNQIASLKSRA